MAGRDWALLDGRETDDNWAARDRLLNDAADELSGLSDHARLGQWAPGLRGRLREAIESTHSSRTQVSVSACRLLAALARHTDVCEDADFFADGALAAGLRVCANTKKIVAAGGTDLLAALLVRLPYARVQALLLSSVLPDRNAALRARVMDVVAAVVAQRGPPRLWADLEAAFVRAIGDAAPAVRLAAVRILEACYGTHAADIRAMLAARLDPLAAKVLRQLLLRSAVCADLVQAGAHDRSSKPWASPQRPSARLSNPAATGSASTSQISAESPSKMHGSSSLSDMASSPAKETPRSPSIASHLSEEAIVEPTRRLSFVQAEMHDEDVPRYVASEEDLRVPMAAILADGGFKPAALQIATPMRAALRHRCPVASPMRPLSVASLVAQLSAPPVAIATWKKLCLLAEQALASSGPKGAEDPSSNPAAGCDAGDPESPFVASSGRSSPGDAAGFPCEDVLRATADVVCAGVVPVDDLGTVGVLVRTALLVGGTPSDLLGATRLLLFLTPRFESFADLWACEPPLLWLPPTDSRLLWLASCAERRAHHSSDERVLLLSALASALAAAPPAWLPPVVPALMAVWAGAALDVAAKRALMPCLAVARAALGAQGFARALPQPMSPAQQRLLDAYCEYNHL